MKARLAAAAVATTLALSSCGEDDGDTTTTTPPPTGVGEQSTPVTPGASPFPPEFLDCMTDQGVDVQSSEEIHAPEAQAAFQACLQFLHSP